MPSVQAALRRIILPEVEIHRIPLSEAVKLLAKNARVYDPQDIGVNIVAIDPEDRDPCVTLCVQDLSLEETLSLIAESVGFRLYMEPQVAVLRPAIQSQRYTTQRFPLSRAALIEMTGLYAQLENNTDTSRIQEEQALTGFLGRSGIVFEEGTRLAYDGSQLYLTHSAEALAQTAQLLEAFASPRQVQIEIKFLEVSQNALEELGVNWFLNNNANNYVQTADPRFLKDPQSPTHLRSLGQAHSLQGAQSNSGLILGPHTPKAGLRVPQSAPANPGAMSFSSQAFSNASLGGIWQGLNIRAVVRALEQRNDSELLHAPNITVVSGKTAEIKVVRKLYYPESYGETRTSCSTEAPGKRHRSGSPASIAITSGRPEKFTSEEIGVKVCVTPRVETDGSIHLELTPTVTNLKDWILYGGSSFMVSGRTTVEVPPGFYQPVFESRTLRTEVRLCNGHTLLMGGLTHEEATSVDDKIPLLGHLPLIGKLFRSKGESARKSTLLIAATAWVVPSGQEGLCSAPSLELLQPPLDVPLPEAPKRTQRRRISSHRSPRALKPAETSARPGP